MTPYIILFIFTIVAILALLEEKIKESQISIIFYALAVFLILLAGLREIGIDYDSANYADAYINYDQGGVEISFIFISAILNTFSHNAHFLFMTYAIIGVSLKFISIKRLSNSIIISAMIYLCYYYEMQECMQIRSGVLAGFYLMSIPYIAEKKKAKAVLCILTGCFFHISGLLLIPILFLNNTEFTKKDKIKWSLVIPFSYILYFAGVTILLSFDIPYIGQKLEVYQRMNDIGNSELGINVFNPLLLMNIMMFYYLMYFSKSVQKESKYFPILMKCYALGISAYMIFSFLPVLALRANILISVVSIILISNIAYTIKPRWASICGLIVFCILYLNYGLKCFEGFIFLWQV